MDEVESDAWAGRIPILFSLSENDVLSYPSPSHIYYSLASRFDKRQLHLQLY